MVNFMPLLTGPKLPNFCQITKLPIFKNLFLFSFLNENLNLQIPIQQLYYLRPQMKDFDFKEDQEGHRVNW